MTDVPSAKSRERIRLYYQDRSVAGVRQRTATYEAIMQALGGELASRCCDDDDDRHEIARVLAKMLQEGGLFGMTTEAELDELDREYYRSKLDELSWCLPVVRAAQAFRDELEEDPGHGYVAAELNVCRAVEAYEAAMKGKA